MLVQWNQEKFSISIDEIDNQHKQLFILVNQVHQLTEGEHNLKEKLKVLKRVYAYTSFHFSTEEGMFKQYNYPGREGHKNYHLYFRNKIKEALEDVRDKPATSLEPLQDFLVKWILGHIQVEDKKYAHWFSQEGINPNIHFSLSEKGKDDILSLWQDKQLGLDIKEIDKQHKELIAILQQANDLQHNSVVRRRTFLPIILEKLFYYCQFHFSYEEEQMAGYSYEGLSEQKRMHKGFIKEIISFAESYKKGERDINDKIVLFLKDWTVNHILKEDKKYKDLLSRGEIKINTLH